MDSKMVVRQAADHPQTLQGEIASVPKASAPVHNAEMCASYPAPSYLCVWLAGRLITAVIITSGTRLWFIHVLV